MIATANQAVTETGIRKRFRITVDVETSITPVDNDNAKRILTGPFWSYSDADADEVLRDPKSCEEIALDRQLLELLLRDERRLRDYIGRRVLDIVFETYGSNLIEPDESPVAPEGTENELMWAAIDLLPAAAKEQYQRSADSDDSWLTEFFFNSFEFDVTSARLEDLGAV
jgi:hypothetical protein